MLRVADGKQYHSDALSAEDIMLLSKHYPNNRQASWTKTSVSDSRKIKAWARSALTTKTMVQMLINIYKNIKQNDIYENDIY